MIGVSYYWKHQGDLSRSFRYDAADNTVVRDRRDVGHIGEPTPSRWLPRASRTWLGSVAAALPDGRVLVAGGSGPTTNGSYPGSDGTDIARYYDPATNTWPDAPDARAGVRRQRHQPR